MSRPADVTWHYPAYVNRLFESIKASSDLPIGFFAIVYHFHLDNLPPSDHIMQPIPQGAYRRRNRIYQLAKSIPPGYFATSESYPTPTYTVFTFHQGLFLLWKNAKLLGRRDEGTLINDQGSTNLGWESTKYFTKNVQDLIDNLNMYVL